MFVAGHFTFPLAVGTGVASDGIVKSAAAPHRAVTQHHDMSVVGFHAVEKPCGGEVKSVPDHHRCPQFAAQPRCSAGRDCTLFCDGLETPRWAKAPFAPCPPF